ncbi:MULTISPECIES: HD domain-containing protein [Chryseobacterium]|uniref:HD domain-containing protein n=1 Tax=Chryseobacterium TaxID=59732 RepID=UPI000489F11E|nr:MULTISPECIES: HD domain-containing protein [Chryseobacterium]
MNIDNLKSIYEVIKLSENLKKELRHSWLSDNRRESVAEHTWRVSFMAILLEPLIKEEFHGIDYNKVIRMIIVHDIVEAISGDVFLTEQIKDPSIKLIKKQKEKEAIKFITDKLKSSNGEEILELFLEFEDKKSIEAIIANSMDKLEAQIQHNQSNIDTWEEIEYSMTYILNKHTKNTLVMDELRKIIVDDAELKMKEKGLDIEDIKIKSTHL